LRPEDLVLNGRVADLVLAVMAAEFVLMLAFAKPGARAALARDLLLMLAPGACLLLALRAALTGAGWLPVAAWLAVSLPFHLADLARRVRRQPTSAPSAMGRPS
jgi:hypothetical protein